MLPAVALCCIPLLFGVFLPSLAFALLVPAVNCKKFSQTHEWNNRTGCTFFVIHGCRSSSAGPGLSLTSRIKQESRKSFNSWKRKMMMKTLTCKDLDFVDDETVCTSDMPSGSGGCSQATILNNADMAPASQYGGLPVSSSMMVHPKLLRYGDFGKEG